MFALARNSDETLIYRTTLTHSTRDSSRVQPDDYEIIGTDALPS
jgi:hypothetical protein